jgi:hypothetical protein
MLIEILIINNKFFENKIVLNLTIICLKGKIIAYFQDTQNVTRTHQRRDKAFL